MSESQKRGVLATGILVLMYNVLLGLAVLVVGSSLFQVPLGGLDIVAYSFAVGGVFSLFRRLPLALIGRFAAAFLYFVAAVLVFFGGADGVRFGFLWLVLAAASIAIPLGVRKMFEYAHIAANEIAAE